jgi:hypothetical protein
MPDPDWHQNEANLHADPTQSLHILENQNYTIAQCCGSGMFIPDPGSRILIFTHPGSRIPDPGSRIPDPGSKNSNKREG